MRKKHFENILNKIKNTFLPFYRSKEIKYVFDILENGEDKNKKVAMFVGGCVRNYILNKKIDDIDIATSLTPEQIKDKFKETQVRIISTGLEHGSITLIYKKSKFEITTLRKDKKTFGRHAEVSYINDWLEDSKRRDITINAIYLDRKGKIYDPQNGKSDLKNKIVKFIGEPSNRIKEDYLRIIRFIRFALQYDSSTDIETIDALKLNLNGINTLSKERIFNELIKILKLKNFNNILKHPNKKLIFMMIFPELKYLDRIKKIEKLSTAKAIEIDSLLLLAILLIDGSNNHEYFCHKYKTSNEIKEQLIAINKDYEQYVKDTSFLKNNLKKNIFLLGKNRVKNLVKLRHFSDKNNKEKDLFIKLNEIENIMTPKFPINGSNLKDRGLNEGKKIGHVLNILQKQWIDNNFSLSEKEISITLDKEKN